MRLIDADALMEVLKLHFDASFGEDGRLLASDHICTSIEPTKADCWGCKCSKMERSQWIPVSERLPNDGELVLCTHRGKFGSAEQVVEHTFLNGKFVCNWAIDLDRTSPTYGECLVGEIIAWMPLPEPYKDDNSCKKCNNQDWRLP